jgi:hypothetical protein
MADPSRNTPTSVGVKAALVGAVTAILCAPFAAAIIATVYRFPVPFGEYAHGINEAVTAALASVFYLVLGGAVVLGVLGAAAGLLAVRIAMPDTARVFRLTFAACGSLALIAAFALALLEFAIGPW